MHSIELPGRCSGVINAWSRITPASCWRRNCARLTMRSARSPARSPVTTCWARYSPVSASASELQPPPRSCPACSSRVSIWRVIRCRQGAGMAQQNPTQQRVEEQIEDVDPQESREWLDALDAVIKQEGPERAHYLLDLLIERSRRSGADRKSTRLNSSHVSISYAVF